MSNELAQPTEQDDPSRSPLVAAGTKKSKPPALDISNCMSSFSCDTDHGIVSGGNARARTNEDVAQNKELTSPAATDAPQPPSSSTQATSTAPNTISTEESERTEVSAVQNEKDYLAVVDEAPATSKKHRGLLHVPSRSSSQKVEPSPTSTGLSGVTASDPQEATGLKSKGSKGSILGRRRNGSATSSRMSTTQAGAPSGATKNAKNTTPDTTPPRQQKKSFLSMLCCSVPEDTEDANDPELLANRVSKPPAARPISASRPENAVIRQQDGAVPNPQTEKEALKQAGPGHDQHEASNLDQSQPGGTAVAANGELNRSVSTRDQPLPALPKESGTSAGPVSQAAIVQVPVRTSTSRIPTAADQGANRENGEGEARVENTEPLPNEKGTGTDAIVKAEEDAKAVLPPPPPVPQAAPTEEAVPETSEGRQQWLLPPITSRFKGKKCLVLDLDETLVHSSFKVRTFLSFWQCHS